MPVAAFSHYFVQNNGLHGLFFPLGQRENECIILLSGTLGNMQFSLNSYSSTVGTLGIMWDREAMRRKTIFHMKCISANRLYGGHLARNHHTKVGHSLVWYFQSVY